MKKSTYILFLFLLAAFSSTAQYVIHLTASDSCGFAGDGGPAINATLHTTYGLCRDPSGNLYFTDLYTTGRIRKISAATGTINTIAGGGTATGDSIPATTLLFQTPEGLCIDNKNNLLIADGDDKIWKVNLATGIITVVAGTARGYSGDGGPATAAKMTTPVDVAVDSDNNIYIADNQNNVIRKISAATGIISTVAGTGTGGFNGDNIQATAAELGRPEGIYVDKNADIYIADGLSRVRMVNAATGIITTIAGTGVGADSGDGGQATAAKVASPQRITMDKAGNLYISNSFVIRRIDVLTHIITTYAGTGLSGGAPDSTGDGGLAIHAPMQPMGMCFDTCGNLFFADYQCRIRAVVPELPTSGVVCHFLVDAVPQVAATAGGMQVYPNPSAGLFTINIPSNTTEPAHIIITNIVGQKVKELTAATGKPIEVQLTEPPGMYFIEAVTTGGRWREKIVVN